MPTNTNQPNEVLHSENHARLTAEEIAKAVARHNKHHPAGEAAKASAKAKKATKR